MDSLAAWRDEFPILRDTVYMISNSLGAMPRRTIANLADYATTWATRGVRAWEERWWEMPLEVGNRVARVIGAPEGTVSMHENVTAAHMTALSCIRPAPNRRRIVCSAMDFPSVVHLLRAQSQHEFELIVVPAEADLSVSTERLIAAIDASTAVVAVSHVLFRTSFIMDVAAIVARAHAVGARAILDLYQSAGIVPLNVTALQVDFAIGGCLKWLCGGPGNAFMYTRPDVLADARPAFTGWVANQAPFQFDAERLEPRADAMRMMNGTPAIPAYYAAIGGLDVINEVGVEAIRNHSIRMTQRLLARVDECGFTSAASRDPRKLAGTVAVDVPDALRVSRTLKARNFLIDYRPPVGIRVSPHFYNTADEVDAIMSELSSIVRTRDYADGDARSRVT